MPAMVLPMMASSEESMMAARRSAASPRSCRCGWCASAILLYSGGCLHDHQAMVRTIDFDGVLYVTDQVRAVPGNEQQNRVEALLQGPLERLVSGGDLFGV